MTGSSSTNFSVDSYWWGLQSFADCEKLQNKIHQKVLDENLDGMILAGEIKPVITQGIRAQKTDLINPQFEVFKIRRGGETTLHAPGQVVIYPIVNLRKLNLGVRGFVQFLLSASEKTFRFLNVPAKMSLDPVGLFTSTGKLGFCGLQIKNGVSLHGLALNISNDLKYFDSIVSCGIKHGGYDKLSSYKADTAPEEFFNLWMKTAFPKESRQKNQIPHADFFPKDFSSSESAGPLF